MGLFDKNKEEKESVEGSVSSSQDTDKTLEELEKRRAERLGIIQPGKRGRRPKAEALQDELTKDLFKPSVWQEVSALPFNIRKAMTGSEIFDLNSDQKQALGGPLALIMKMLVEIDPKYLALLVFSINLGSIWTEKEILWSIEKRKHIKPKKLEVVHGEA